MRSKTLNTMSVPARSYGSCTLSPNACLCQGHSLQSVVDDRALLIDREHRALREPVTRAAIQHHDLVLADLRGVVGDAR